MVSLRLILHNLIQMRRFPKCIVNIGKYMTHLIISDEEARMLIVLTDLTAAKNTIKRETPQLLRVLGMVERGKKGLPYVLAKALNIVEN